MYNPFVSENGGEEKDRDLAARAVQGDGAGLEELIRRHQP